MSKPLSIAVAGLGVVGGGLLALLRDQAQLMAERAGRPLRLSAVSARDRTKDRGVSLESVAWFDDPVAMAREAQADVVVELIGGDGDPAKAVCEAAIAAGRHVVTANKALLAHHGADLARRAEAAGVAIGYEAAVAGGIPIIKALREGLAANRIDRVVGILNGTCNYILTVMRETGRPFADVLAEAQAHGYAEADPTLDVEGIDAAHKLALLASLAFGAAPDFDAVAVEGIRAVDAIDITFAEELGYRVKLLGIAERGPGGIRQRVRPCLVPRDAPLARIDGVFNAVEVSGSAVGDTLFSGRGAGAGPTASAVAADLLDIARGQVLPVFGVAADRLASLAPVPPDQDEGAAYVRLTVRDQAGVFADIAAILRDEGVSMESVIQRGRAGHGGNGNSVPVVMVLHETREAALRAAIARFADLPAVLESPRLLRIQPV